MKRSPPAVVGRARATVVKSEAPRAVRRSIPRFRAEPGNVAVPDTKDLKAWYAALERIIHTNDGQLSQVLLSQAAISLDGSVPFADRVNTSLTAIEGIAPRDALEALLAVQMVATHNLALDFLKRATNPNAHPELVSEQINRAAKLMRAYSAQIGALERHRGYGKQHVTVEHVHVNAGGQAIVGAVQRGGGEG